MNEEQICLACDKKFIPWDKKNNHICPECSEDEQRKEYFDILDVSTDILEGPERETFDDDKWRDTNRGNLV